jgi:hypothetical protein
LIVFFIFRRYCFGLLHHRLYPVLILVACYACPTHQFYYWCELMSNSQHSLIKCLISTVLSNVKLNSYHTLLYATNTPLSTYRSNQNKVFSPFPTFLNDLLLNHFELIQPYPSQILYFSLIFFFK